MSVHYTTNEMPQLQEVYDGLVSHEGKAGFLLAGLVNLIVCVGEIDSTQPEEVLQKEFSNACQSYLQKVMDLVGPEQLTDLIEILQVKEEVISQLVNQ